MATKGRLVFCEHGATRMEYRVQRILLSPAGPVKYAAVCPCVLGDHYLRESIGGIFEETASPDRPSYRVYSTWERAAAVIETWQRQHEQVQQRQDGE